MSRQVLIVDDEEDVRTIAQLGLELRAGWQVLIARSGKEAIQIAAQFQPDVILLDLMMPEMDGRATLQQLKANPQTRSIPVILVTAKAQQLRSEIAAGLDVATVIAKPFHPLQLANQISSVMGWSDEVVHSGDLS
jgi:CheY-like chemotaxis protein